MAFGAVQSRAEAGATASCVRLRGKLRVVVEWRTPCGRYPPRGVTSVIGNTVFIEIIIPFPYRNPAFTFANAPAPGHNSASISPFSGSIAVPR